MRAWFLAVFLLLMLFLLFLFFAAGSKEKKPIISLFTLFVCLWVLVLILGVINAYNLYAVSIKFCLLLFLGIVCWLLGFISIRFSRVVFSFGFHPKKKEELSVSYQINMKAVYIYLAIIAAFSVGIGMVYLQFMANGMTYGQFHSFAFGQYEDRLFESPALNFIYSQIMYPAVLSLLPVCAISFFYNRRKISLVCASIIIIYCLLIGRRFPILYLGLDYVLAFAFFRETISKKTLRKVALVVVFFFFIIVIISGWRKDAFKTGDWSPVFKTYYTYFNLCLQLGDYWIEYVDKYASDVWMFGYSFFYGVLDNVDAILRKFGLHLFNDFNVLINLPENNFVRVGVDLRANAFATWIYYFYLDFREIGVALGSFIFGFIVGYVERITIIKKDLFHIVFYLLFAQAVFKSFVRWEFNQVSYVLAFVFLRVLLNKCTDSSNLINI